MQVVPLAGGLVTEKGPIFVMRGEVPLLLPYIPCQKSKVGLSESYPDIPFGYRQKVTHDQDYPFRLKTGESC